MDQRKGILAIYTFSPWLKWSIKPQPESQISFCLRIPFTMFCRDLCQLFTINNFFGAHVTTSSFPAVVENTLVFLYNSKGHVGTLILKIIHMIKENYYNDHEFLDAYFGKCFLKIMCYHVPSCAFDDDLNSNFRDPPHDQREQITGPRVFRSFLWKILSKIMCQISSFCRSIEEKSVKQAKINRLALRCASLKSNKNPTRHPWWNKT